MSVERDWTRGPAKTAAVLALGAAGLGGLAYSVMTERTPWRAGQGRAWAVRAEEGRAAAGAGEVAAARVAVRIDLNTADAKTLELLPGIGPALAERIIADRGRIGPFKRVEDLARVKGIGHRTIERLREHAVVGEQEAE